MSPLERCFSRKLLVIRADTVPLPDPGGPIIITRKILWRDIPARFFCPAFQCRAAYLRCRGGNHSWMRNWIRFHFLLLEVCNVAQRGGGLCSPSTLTQPSLHFLPCYRETNEEEEVQRRRGGGGGWMLQCRSKQRWVDSELNKASFSNSSRFTFCFYCITGLCNCSKAD